jgi:hypothetical protein
VGKGGYVCVEVGTGDSATDAAADEISAQVASLFVVLTAVNAATTDLKRSHFQTDLNKNLTNQTYV